MKKFREMKKNNKGFSLVELIVVIAIMVVLVAVLGSTILGYVEKSKYSKDIQALDSVKTAVSTYVSDPKCNYTNAATDVTLAALMTETADPNQVIYKTLQEVFTFGTGDAKLTGAVFNNASSAFEGLALSDIKVFINNGAVSIYAPVRKAEQGNYDPYRAGTYFENETAVFE